MFKFPKDLYTDVRIEDVFQAVTILKDKKLEENKQRKYKGAFIRIFDGDRWYYSSTTQLDTIDDEIQMLAQMATPNPDIYSHETVQKLEVNQQVLMRHDKQSVRKVTKSEQQQILLDYIDVVEQCEAVKEYNLRYLADSVIKSFYSSKGTQVTYDKETCALIVNYTLSVGDKRFDTRFDKTVTCIEEVKGLSENIKEDLETSKRYIEKAVPVVPGKYTVVFAPIATGVFAHESFGHKSEADLMLGSEAMKEIWKIGKKVGSSQLSILDRGDLLGSGYIPFDDEGNRARVNYLIKDGKLAGRLHTASTSTELDEDVTGNARAMNFEYEPIVRMTTTYVEKGDLSKEAIFEGIAEGIYIQSISHGSGMTDFTIAPKCAYMIRDGKIAEPVMVSVVTGGVMETLHEIDGISDEIEIFSFSGGGCGKMEQYPLQVSFGGPYIRVQNIDVQ